MSIKPKKYSRIISAIDKGYSSIDGNIVSKTGRIRKEYIPKNGYKQFSINYEGKSVVIESHSFIAAMKFGIDELGKGVQVRHIDGNNLNNRIENIEIGTPKQNQNDIPAEQRSNRTKKGYQTRKRGTRFKLSESQVMLARQLYERGPIRREISAMAKEFGVSRGTIRLSGTYKFNKLVGV
jgi:hypothetical protein